ncbi:Iron-dependent extradiol dioxygenase [Sinobacterium norvegicum]|uniref:Iron-dependent extradiol dioxygenase n=1 Tax=Sinobacterium norvegicum TaxID=1641715 RepID=A0ABN8EIZ3_9GAMM|nr:VOC family protein [Sinobacterium norvegicum]CAH0992341.1 Iron-dependent extradiol dioxygenase [Sinobacterium norvegicum]
MDIRSLGYVEIESTDLTKWRKFGTEVLGLMVANNMPDDGNLYLRMDECPYRFRIVSSDKDRLNTIAWEVPGEKAFEQALQELEAAGVSYQRGSQQQADDRCVRGFVSFTDPGNHNVEIFYNMKLDYASLISPVGVKNFVTGHNGDMGLGHIAMPTSDLAASHKFYTEVMGFGQVDYMHFNFSGNTDDPGQGLHFLHVNNPRHHSLALFQDANPHAGDCVHMMIEVEDIHTVGHMMDRVHQHEVRTVTGLGCHTNDEMISVYVETPAGFAMEYGYGGLQVDWATYTPTESAVPSTWGHRWGQG